MWVFDLSQYFPPGLLIPYNLLQFESAKRSIWNISKASIVQWINIQKFWWHHDHTENEENNHLFQPFLVKRFAKQSAMMLNRVGIYFDSSYDPYYSDHFLFVSNSLNKKCFFVTKNRTQHFTTFCQTKQHVGPR